MQKLLMVGASDGMQNSVRPHLYLERERAGLDVRRYERAVNATLARHLDVLVTVTTDLELRPIEEFVPLTVGYTDLTGVEPAAAQRELDRLRDEMSTRPLPFDRWPWLEFHATRYGGDRVRLHINFSNFFLDLYSGASLLHEIDRLYDDPAAPPAETGPTLREATLALAAVEAGPLGKRARGYWMDRLDSLPEPPPLPLVHNDGRHGGLRRRQLELGAPEWSTVKTIAGELGLTPSAVLLAVYAEVIAQFSGSRHFLLTNLMTRRLIPATARVFGNFSSVYPLEVDWRGELTFLERCRVLQRQLLRDFARTHTGGLDVLEALSRARSAPGSAVCPFVVAAGLTAGPQERVGFSRLETPQALVDHQFWELDGGSLWVVWDVLESAFPPGFLDEMCSAYERLLRRFASEPDAWQEPVGTLVEPRVLDLRDAATPVHPAPSELLTDLLPTYAAERPGHTAAIGLERSLTRTELHSAAKALAARLQSSGVVPGDLVAVILPKSIEQIVAVHAVLLAGGAYVPIDPAWPRERRDALLSIAEISSAITEFELPGIRCLSPQGDDTGEPAPVSVAQSDLAYVIYTSGSTGTPKGVALNHLGPLNTIVDIKRRFGITDDDIVFAVSALHFDLSVFDVFCGATLVLPDPDDPTPGSWLRLLRTHHVTVWNSAPGLMQLLVEAADGVTLPALRLVLLSGDWIPVTLPDRIRRIAPNAEVISLGGATEASIWSIYHRIGAVDPSWTSIPYGRPLANQPWYILDELGLPAPTWTTGELHIGGIGLATGYLGDPDKTDAAFVRHRETGERIYRTGDLGRYLPGGEIELIGRADQQVKIQGWRIEPGEIEHALLAEAGVRDAAVLACDSPTGKRLIGYVTPDDLDVTALRTALAERLPAPLVPADLIALDRLPVTGNGKLDRRALLALRPDPAVTTREPVAPRTPREAALFAIWASVLGIDAFGVEDDFFDLGGHSFAALQVVTRIRQQLGVDAALGTLLTARTIAALAEGLARPDSALVTLDSHGTRTPCFFVHPAGGTVFAYRDLAARLDRPCHAFQVVAPLPATVAEFAARYRAELRRVQPHGPYVVGGWSSGAAIALELAAELEREGEHVEQLVIFDAPAPATMPAPDHATLRAWFAEDLGGTDPGGDLDHLFAVFSRVVLAARTYPGRPVRAPIRLLRAVDGRVSEFDGYPDVEGSWGWDRFARNGVEVIAARGTHLTMFDHGAALAAILDEEAPEPMHQRNRNAHTESHLG
ncbi:amino acid adenylation domain-containing protein [Nocardia puris]|uniref:non-ribosomal peptide synthetase n=1 Tax=Nocardia puris TaxID=208602 RepID=UPI0018961646|nr:non-ribosomal peptide synthetase [Nocardia puris]MBF6369672.1 amino acid adenylation domain-containing protein [Nocardia puris]